MMSETGLADGLDPGVFIFAGPAVAKVDRDQNGRPLQSVLNVKL